MTAIGETTTAFYSITDAVIFAALIYVYFYMSPIFDFGEDLFKKP